MTEQMRLEDYPPGVQCLLKDAVWHVEQLTILELDFRAWQTTQGKTGATTVYVNSQGQEVQLFAPHGHPEPWALATTASEGEITTATRLTKSID